MKNTKRYWQMFYRSKMNILAAVIAALSTLQLAMPQLTNSMTAEGFALLGVGVAVAIAFFRSLTNEPLSEKVDKPEGE